jgi:curved DNA-binding protein
MDHYQTLGIDRNATADDIKQAYRRLARKYHPDISKESKSEERFKEIAEAYATLKDPSKRHQYDNHDFKKPMECTTPPPDWSQTYMKNQQAKTYAKAYAKNKSIFEDVDLSDIFSKFSRDRKGSRPVDGQDYEISAPVSLEEVFHGEEIEINASIPQFDQDGMTQHCSRTFRIKVPKGATDGQRLRLPGKGGAGRNGGKPGDLYISLKLTRHPLYRISGSDLYIDLPLTPWEAVLGSTVKIPTLGGIVELSLKSGATAGQKLRLPQRGLPTADGKRGDLYAIVKLAVPKKASAHENHLYRQLATVSDFNPRQHFNLII